MFGWHPRLAVDAFLGINNSQKQIKSQKIFAQKVQRRLNFAQRVAGGNITKNTGRSQQNYDQKVRFEKLEVGNRVLVRKLVFSGRSKLTDKGERDPYIVIKQSVSDIPVYVVRKESGSDKVKTLHRKSQDHERQNWPCRFALK